MALHSGTNSRHSEEARPKRGEGKGRKQEGGREEGRKKARCLMRPRAAGIRHELHKRSRTRMREALNTPKAAPEGGQGGRKPRLATATLPIPRWGTVNYLNEGAK